MSMGLRRHLARKQQLFMIGTLFLLSILAVSAYWFFGGKPESLPPEEALAEEINRLYPEADVGQIEDIIFLDEGHAFIPFRSKKGSRGFSLWKWQWHRWQVAAINTSGWPSLVKRKEGQPATYDIVWHLHPDDPVDKIAFYLIRERHLAFFDEKELYLPAIQMEEEVSLHEKTYGSISLPESWVQVMDSLIVLEKERQPPAELDAVLSHLSLPPSVNIYAIFYDEKGQEVYPERDVISSQYSSGSLSVDTIIIWHTDQLFPN